MDDKAFRFYDRNGGGEIVDVYKINSLKPLFNAMLEERGVITASVQILDLVVGRGRGCFLAERGSVCEIGTRGVHFLCSDCLCHEVIMHLRMEIFVHQLTKIEIPGCGIGGVRSGRICVDGVS